MDRARFRVTVRVMSLGFRSRLVRIFGEGRTGAATAMGRLGLSVRAGVNSG